MEKENQKLYPFLKGKGVKKNSPKPDKVIHPILSKKDAVCKFVCPAIRDQANARKDVIGKAIIIPAGPG
jgi:hypothetical protein